MTINFIVNVNRLLHSYLGFACACTEVNLC